MAQTRRRRQTKHRGNAAGVVETRGRTGRKPTTSERKPAAGGKAVRPNRYDQPPTWRGSAKRTLIPLAIVLVVFVIVLRRSVVSLLILVPFLAVTYVPLTYYTDLFLYRRRQRQKAAGKLPR